MTLIDLLILLCIVVGIGWVAHWLITTFFPEPIRMIALMVVGVLLLIFLLSQFSPVSSGFHVYHYYR